MRIKKLELSAFGLFSGYNLDLADGMQVLAGDNEAGKSTVMSFLRLMFYGKVERTQSIDRNLRKKYAPWDGSVMEGAVEFECDGRLLRLQKTFGETPGKDRISLLDLGTGESVPLRRDEEIGRRYFGLDAAGFEHSCFIGRIGAVSTDGKTDAVTERLMVNLAQSGDMQVSGQASVDRLTAAREALISKSGKKGLLVQARQDLAALLDEKALTELMLQEQEHLQRQYLEAQERLARKNRVEQLLDGMEAAGKIHTLNTIEQKFDHYCQIIRDLERKGLSEKTLPPLVQNLKALSMDYRAAVTAYENLLASSGGEAAVEPVSQEDFQEAELLERQISLGSALLDGWRNTLLPALEDCLNKQQTDAVTRQALAACQTELTGLEAVHLQHAELLKQQSREQLALDELEHNRASREPVLKEKMESFRSDRGYLHQVLDEQNDKSKKHSRIRTIVAAVLIVAAVMALYSLFDERLLLFTLLLAALPPLIYRIRWSVRGQSARKADGLQMYDVAQQRVQDAKDQIQEFQDIYQSTRAELSDRLEQIRQQLDTTAPQAARYEECEYNLDRLCAEALHNSAELKASRLIFNRHVELLIPTATAAADAGLPVFEIPSSPIQISADHTSELEAFLDFRKSRYTALLQQFQLDSVEALRNQYLQYSSDRKNRSAIKHAKEEMEKLEATYLEAASVSEPVSGAEQAGQVLLSLQETMRQLEELRSQVRHMAAGIGLPEVISKNLIAQRKTALQPVADAWDPNSDPDEEALRQEFTDLSVEDLLQTLQSLQQKLQTPARTPQELEREILNKTAEVQQMETYHKSLALAHQIMLESVEEMRGTFSPELNRKTGNILSALTGGRYSEVLVSEDYTVRVRSGSHYREYQYLSSGTIDQTYLALRLAVSDLLSSGSEPLPLILDDVLMQYDDGRTEQCLAFLREYADSRPGQQIILFTCHGHIATLAQNQSIPCRDLLQEQSV